MIMKAVLAFAAVTAVLAHPAVGADLPVRAAPAYNSPPFAVAVYNWSGFYVGGNLGGAWGDFDANTTTVFSPIGYFATTSPPAINAVGAQHIHASGFTGGGQAGYNWQAGSIVYGIEVDIDHLGLKGSTSATGVYPCCAPTPSQ
jgi:outer membrane immunogenic protein